MFIRSTQIAKKIVERDPDVIAQLMLGEDVVVDIALDETEWQQTMESELQQLIRDDRISDLVIRVRTTSDFDRENQDVQAQINAVVDGLGGQEAFARSPSRSYAPIRPGAAIGTGAVIGAVGGAGVGLLLQDLGKLGQSSGNSVISTAAIGITLIGTAAGAGIGAGVSTGVMQLNGRIKVPRTGIEVEFQIGGLDQPIEKKET